MTRLRRWRSGRRRALALRVPMFRPGTPPPYSTVGAALWRLNRICPAVRDFHLVRAERGAVTVRIRLKRWTWLTGGLLHYFTARNVVRYRTLWAPPGVNITVEFQ